jgi:hypothetical protein
MMLAAGFEASQALATFTVVSPRNPGSGLEFGPRERRRSSMKSSSLMGCRVGHVDRHAIEFIHLLNSFNPNLHDPYQSGPEPSSCWTGRQSDRGI